MTDVPAATPVNIPFAMLIVATAALLLVYAPGLVAQVSVVVLPTQALVTPPIVAGVPFIVTIVVL